MTEIMLRDANIAHGLRHVILRYFNVAGADPLGRTGQSTRGATRLIKVALETALGLRPKKAGFGIDYPTADGTCIRDYIHGSDLVRAHCDALAYRLASGDDSRFRSKPCAVCTGCLWNHSRSFLASLCVNDTSALQFSLHPH